MSRKITSILLCAFCAWSFSSSAQINLKGLKNKASNAMEDAIEKKVEKEMNKAAERVVEKYWERVLGKYYAGLYEGGTDGGTTSFPYYLDENVELEDEYIFMHSVKMQIDTYKKNGKLDETVFINSHTNSDLNYMGTSIQNEDDNSTSFVINDFKNKCLVILVETEGRKSRIAYSLKYDEELGDEMTEAYEEEIQEMVDDSLETIEPLKYEEIGTKEILGHTCKGYRSETESSIAEIWMAHEDVFGMENIFGAKDMQNGNRDKMIASGFPMGSLMEYSNLEIESKRKTVTQVVEISENVELRVNPMDYPTTAELQAEAANEE